jgi:YgiT-type zinc finger domain-containing protein
MSATNDDSFEQAQRNLAAWRSTHPRATLAEIEVAVEEQIEQLRTDLIKRQTEAGFVEEHPLCRECGTTMKPQATTKRTLLLRGDQPLELERSYVVCPSCGAGLFPPG